jgi:anti-anti-sigma factor
MLNVVLSGHLEGKVAMVKSYKQGCVVVIDCDERFDASQTDSMRDLVQRYVAQGSSSLVCDLRKTRVMDSKGLELLLDLAATCGKNHGCLKIAGANELCRDILLVTGVSEQIEIFPDVLSAVGAFAL